MDGGRSGGVDSEERVANLTLLLVFTVLAGGGGVLILDKAALFFCVAGFTAILGAETINNSICFISIL